MEHKVANYLQDLEGGVYGELKPATEGPRPELTDLPMQHAYRSTGDPEHQATKIRSYKRPGLASPEVYKAVETLARAFESGYNVNSVAGEHGRELIWGTPLMVACARDQSSPLLVELIIGLGADVDRGSNNGFPLEIAARKGHIQVVEILLRELKRLVQCSNCPERISPDQRFMRPVNLVMKQL
jgi:hypothetical protein